MPSLKIAVLGAGTAGLSATLALARDGHDITLVERDPVSSTDALASLAWERKGIKHFFQPHAFMPRGRKEMRRCFPDVYDCLIEAGAWDLDLRPKIRGPLVESDAELVYLAARRPLIEWALRKAVLSEPNVRVVDGTRVTGFDGTRAALPILTSVRTDNGAIDADVVVDAMGRRSPASAWLAEMGARVPPVRESDCAIIYYSRYYRVREGASLTDGPWIPTPRSDLGYAAFSTFPGDNRTFAAILAINTGDHDLRSLKDVDTFEAAAADMPALHAWTNPDTSEPITEVLPMGSLQNTLRTTADDVPQAIGVFSVADAVCHTDPVLALGLSFSLIHADALARALREHPADLGDAALAFDGSIRSEMEERFAFSSALDEQRAARWRGEAVDIAHRDGGAYELFTFAAGTAAALVDGEVFRTVVRRNTFLDPLTLLDEDVGMQKRIEDLFEELTTQPRPAPGPSRDELLELIDRTISARQ